MATPPELREVPDVEPEEHSACDRSVLAAVRRLYIEHQCADAAIGFVASKGCYIARVETAAATNLDGALRALLHPRKVEVLTSFPSPHHRNVMFRVHDSDSKRGD
jgi:hypothetical protein